MRLFFEWWHLQGSTDIRHGRSATFGQPLQAHAKLHHRNHSLFTWYNFPQATELKSWLLRWSLKRTHTHTRGEAEIWITARFTALVRQPYWKTTTAMHGTFPYWLEITSIFLVKADTVGQNVATNDAHVYTLPARTIKKQLFFSPPSSRVSTFRTLDIPKVKF